MVRLWVVGIYSDSVNPKRCGGPEVDAGVPCLYKPEAYD